MNPLVRLYLNGGMTPETMTALKASIVFWEENVAAETVREISEVSPLCELFMPENKINVPNICAGCPVVEHTDAVLCVRTPFYDATEHLRDWMFAGDAADRDAWRDAAQNYVAFLKSILPKNEAAQ